MTEVLMWLARFVALLPHFKRLWEAAAAGDDRETTDAQLAFVRGVKDEQAKEAILGGPFA